VRTIPAVATRGPILDRTGQPLASNLLALDLCANPKVVTDAAATARMVAELFGGDAVAYQAKLEAAKQSHFAYLKRGLDREQASAQKQALLTRPELKGIELRPAPRRVYPGGPLGAALLGYTNIDGQGIEGLELAYNRLLGGRDGHIQADVDARQAPIPGTERQVVPPIDGKPLKLTVDATIQQFSEQELQKAVDLYHPEGACAIVMDVQTGEILALANEPGYDPNNPGSVPADRRRCRAITDTYEPGSIFKVITGSAALEEHTRTDAYCSGAMVIGNHTIHEAHGRAHGRVDLGRIIEQSCNIGAGTLAQRLGAEVLYRHVAQFGFLEKTGIELAGETRGGTSKWQDWKEIRTVNVGFGQGITVTAMQMIRAYAAIANDGLLLRPHIIASIGGKPFEGKTDTRRVMTPDNAREMRHCMERVVNNGTGKAAKIAHYTAAGKTGTAQIAQGGRYLSGAYVASFVGFLPAAQPRLAILVAVRHPIGQQYGGVVAAPVFREIARQTVRYLDLPPDAPDDYRDGTTPATFAKWKRDHPGETEGTDQHDD
jgi:stage V sporulation protein D (sporulation-specific penicillin-binding protein)